MAYTLDELEASQEGNPLLVTVEMEEDNDATRGSVFISTMDGECGDYVFDGELEELVDIYNQKGQPYKITLTVPSEPDLY